MKSAPRFVALPFIVFLLLSCGKDESDPPAPPGQASKGDIIAEGAIHSVKKIKEKYEVTYHDDTVIVSEDAMRYMAPIIDDYQNLEFSIEAKNHLDLEQGKVTIFPGAALGRVESVQERGDKILVKLSPATLNEAIKDADIESLVRIDWNQLKQVTANDYQIKPAGPIILEIFGEAVAADTFEMIERKISFKFKLEDKGIEIKFTLEPKPDKLEFELTAKASKKAHRKSVTPEEAAQRFPNQRVNASNSHADYYHHNEFQPVADDGMSSGSDEGDDFSEQRSGSAGLVGEIKGVATLSGFVSGISQAIDIEITDSTTNYFHFDLRDMNGQIKIESAALQGLAGTFNLKIPLEYAIPLRIGIIPVTVKLGAQLSFRPILELGTGGSSKICFLATWDGSAGFKFENGSFRNESTVSRRILENCGETVSAGSLTVGMGTGVKFPQIKVEIFGNLVVPETYGKLDGVTTYEPGIASAQKACQAGKLDLAWIFKATLDFFGLVGIETESMLWQYKKEWTCEDTVVETTFDKAGGEQKSESPR